MGVLEEVGRSMLHASRARSGRGRKLVRHCWRSAYRPPEFFFVLHVLRLILMQSGQRNVEYTIANNYYNEHYSKPIKSSSKNVTKFHTARMASGTSTL